MIYSSSEFESVSLDGSQFHFYGHDLWSLLSGVKMLCHSQCKAWEWHVCLKIQLCFQFQTSAERQNHRNTRELIFPVPFYC